MNAAAELKSESQPQPRDFPTMREEAFLGLAGKIVRIIEPHTESDPVALLLTIHAFFGNAIGRGPYYLVEGDQHGPNLFVLLIGDTAKARKGTSAGRAKQLFRLADEKWLSQRVHTGLSSGEGVIWEVRDRITRMVKGGKAHNAALEEEEVDPGVSDKRLMIIESEFSGALRVMQRAGSILSRVLRDAWDRGDLASMTKHSPARATGACMSIVGHITADELRAYLDRTEMANGFANRFDFACVRRSKYLAFGGSLGDDAIHQMALDVTHAINQARTVARVCMSETAAEAWKAAYPMLSEGRPGLLGTLTARAEAQVVRLALLYALWDGKDTIEHRHLTAALAVWEYCDASVQYIFGDSLGDVTADTILAALRQSGTRGLTRTEITNLFSRHVSGGQIARALGELSRRNLATMRKDASTGGRPPEIWVAL